ncbi:hypothetical protein FAES_1827 [Fibrella aestuarina BUZ 2]|uniref:SGNH hydrolase-type esterase domain-containing protein n=1 Tax=Fibrella aestuarina BUZ 2 TaxID=1166018 RepID=I0K6T4_9BACT|nr:SGNH/GDSL hydrolase family protein [Fibrella aestuarina]CCG99837.1 hypothetical protein FAES_1827 [Fibrella aestuarina BUZ 2]
MRRYLLLALAALITVGVNAQSKRIAYMSVTPDGGGLSLTLSTGEAVVYNFTALQTAISNISSGTVSPAERIAWNAKTIAPQTFKGGWNASTNSPALSATATTQGDYYEVTTSGTTSVVSGTSTVYSVGDKLLSNGTTWTRIAGVTLGTTIEQGKNLFNVAAVQTGKYVSNSGDGSIGTATGFNLSPVIPVSPGATYTLSGLTNGLQYSIRFENASGTYVAGSAISSTSFPFSFSVPASAAQLVFTCKFNSDATQPALVQLELGSSATAFTAYRAPVVTGVQGGALKAAELFPNSTMNGKALVTADQIANVSTLSFVSPKNLFNPASVTANSAVSTGGDIGTFSGFTISDYIPVTGGAVYTLSGTTGQKAIQFASAAKAKVGFAVTSTYPFSFTVPATATYLIFTAKRSDESVISSTLMLEAGSSATTYEAYFTPYVSGPVQAIQLAAGTKMAGKTVATTDQLPTGTPLPINYTKILAVGSSITDGVGASADSLKYRNVLQATLTAVLGRSITVVNGGLSGQNSSANLSALPSQLAANNPQVVLIEANINDAKSTTAGVGRSTSESNLNSMIDLVIAAGAVPVLWTAGPLDVTTGTGGAFSDTKRLQLNATVRKIAAARNIRLIDIGVHSAYNFLLLADGLHGNDRGHRFNAECLASGFLRN